MTFCEILALFIIICCVCFVMQPDRYEGYLTQCAAATSQAAPIGSNQLIGLVSPPKLGPLHTPSQYLNSDGKDGCPRAPFVAIYSGEPYLKYHNEKDGCN